MKVHPEVTQTARTRGKRILMFPNGARCGYVSIVEWKPKAEPVTLNIPGRGLLQVTAPERFALGALMRLEAKLTGQAEGPNSEWNLDIGEFVDVLRVLGCEVEIETVGGGSEIN